MTEFRDSAASMVDAGFKDYAEVQVDNNSPNRVQDSVVNNAIEVIANFVDKAPNVNAKFHSLQDPESDEQINAFILSTQVYTSARDQLQTESDTQAELNSLVALITDELKKNGFKSPGIKELDWEFEGMGWGSTRNILCTAKLSCTYKV